MEESAKAQLEAAAALADPLRRALYRYVCAADGQVGRDEAARAVGASRHRVASQLDRLAEAGLLEVSFRRLSGRSGPGAGRPAKLYQPSALQIDISVPPQRYGLAADVFAGALQAAAVPQAAVDGAAWDFGHALGEGAGGAGGGRRSRRRTVAALEALAEDYGFQPMIAGRRLALTNCPFRSLVESRGQLVCRMNLSLFRGMLAGLGGGMEARTVPAPNKRGCCVTVGLGSARIASGK
ncbi:MAG: transcriptional regulator [Actinomycetota bacterium]|nr:transcriptional regulator [Actinomycetota bacterium]